MADVPEAAPPPVEDPRDKALSELKKKLLAHKEAEARVKNLREEVKTIKKEYDKTEDDLKALQSVGQIIGEVLRQLDEERCEWGSRRGARATWRSPNRRCSHWQAAATARSPPLTCRPLPPPLRQLSSSRAAGRGTWWAAAARWTRPS